MSFKDGKISEGAQRKEIKLSCKEGKEASNNGKHKWGLGIVICWQKEEIPVLKTIKVFQVE